MAAKFNLLHVYDIAEVVIKDEKEAIQLYKLVSDQGSAVAQFNLAQCYMTGEGVVEAQFNLALCLQKTGIQRDCKMAIMLYKLAANQGYYAAQFSLGICYENGEGVNLMLDI